MRNFLLKRKYKNSLQAPRPEKRYVPFDRIQRILLLCEYTDLAYATTCVESLTHQGKLVDTCSYRAGKTKKERTVRLLTHQGQKHLAPLRCFRRLDKAVFQHLVATPYDLIIDLTTQPHIPMQYALMQAHAACKAGMKHNDCAQLDFIVEIPHPEQRTITQLYTTIVDYLSKIKG